jgi:hypothetical protein
MTALDERAVAPAATMFPHSARRLRADETAQWFAVTGAGEVRYRRVRIALVDAVGEVRDEPWIGSVEAQLNELLRLPPAWDGQRAQAVTEAAVKAVVAVLGEIEDEHGLPPAVFPLPDGGVQAEWHAAGNDVEVEVEGDGSVFVFARDMSGNVTIEGDVAVTGLDTNSPSVTGVDSHLLLKQTGYAISNITSLVQQAVRNG